MKLYWSKTSPYARKARVCAMELGLEDRLELVDTNPRDPTTGLWERNPLAKIPALELPTGEMIYDSPVICEYINETGGGTLLPEASRWRIRTLVAHADGMMDAAMLARLEGMRPASEQSPDWVAKQLAIAARGFERLEREADTLGSDANLATIAIGCAIFWIGLRHPDRDWLVPCPALRDWYAEFAARPSMTATVP